MNKLLTVKKSVALLLSLLLAFSVTTFFASAENGEIAESDTYVLNRDSNGESLYMYQSPCIAGHDVDNMYGAPGIITQIFVFTMYNSVTGEHFPTYCSDIHTPAVQGSNYRRLNLEDSSFSGSAAGRVRAILQNGFYIVPIEGETMQAHEVRMKAKAAEMAKAAGLESLTVGEAISATQTAIWQVVHGPSLSFPTFCRSFQKPMKTKYGSFCSYNELSTKNKDLISDTIRVVYNYLLSLEPVEATEKSVSPASFVNLQDPVLTPNSDGTYNISVTTTVDVDMAAGDSLTLEAQLNEEYQAEAQLSDGSQLVTLNIPNVPASLAGGEVKLSISGYQTAEGFFFFDASGNRTESQSMLGYNNSRLPVYAEVTAAEERILNIYKTTRISDDSNERKALSDIAFDIYPVATMEEFNTKGYKLPDIDEFTYPEYPEYTITTDKNGQATLNFLHHGLPDGVYLIVEQNHPSIVNPIDPFYLFVPMTSPDGTELIYNITVQPKNDINGNLQIEKDVISIGNDESTVDIYESHTWIIGATVPEDIANGKSYVITDTLDNRLDYSGNLKIKLEKIDGSVSPITLIEGTDYKLTVSDKDSLASEKPSDSFRIELTGIGMSKIAKSIGKNSFSDYMLRVYFDAQINANAEMGEKIPNRAELKYVNAVGIEFDKESDIPHVSTGAVNLLKVDAEDNSKTLPGAVFEVYRPATADEIAADDSRLTEISGVADKVIKVSFFDNADLEGDKVTSVTSGEDGKVAIYGLALGKYYLLELQAPTGYNRLSKAQELIIDNSSHLSENKVVILNRTGSLLPETGGIGTTIFTVNGAILICAAVLLLYINKRKSKA